MKILAENSGLLIFVKSELNVLANSRVSVQGVKSLDGHFACLCSGFEFYEVKKNLVIFQRENGNTSTLFIIFMVKSLQKKSKIAQIYYYDPQSAGIDLQSPQSDSTPWTLTLANS